MYPYQRLTLTAIFTLSFTLTLTFICRDFWGSARVRENEWQGGGYIRVKCTGDKECRYMYFIGGGMLSAMNGRGKWCGTRQGTRRRGGPCELEFQHYSYTKTHLRVILPHLTLILFLPEISQK